MSTRRSYREYCGLAKALDVVGERWTLLVVRNLLLGPLRYSDLLRGLPGITTNLLAKRLREMEREGLIERVRQASGPDGAQAYRLTDLGLALEPVVHALGRWGWRRMHRPAPSEHRSLEWLLVALRRRYRGGVTLAAELVADGVPYSVALTPRKAAISRGPLPGATLRIRGPGLGIAELLLGTRAAVPPIAVEGSRAELDTLTGAFDRSEAA